MSEENSSNSAGQQQQQRQYYYDGVHQDQSQSRVVVPQAPLHMQMMPHNQHQQHLNDEQNSSSLVYDRTIKVAKTGYADHGSHGVAALPLHGGGGGRGGAENGSGMAMMAAGAPGGGLQSSVQMQFQMQQMAAAMLHQHQQQHFDNQNQQHPQHQQQQQHHQQQMMPPPSMGGYPSLVPGSMGSQLTGGLGGMMNITSSTGLMQALNAQMTANQRQQQQNQQQQQQQPPASSPRDQLPIDGNGVSNNMLPPTNIASNLSTLTGMNTAMQLGGQVMAGGATNGGGDYQLENGMIAPGDTLRNGSKKRISPSVPLHPSQLGVSIATAGPATLPQQHNGLAIPMSMHAVAEEEESSGVHGTVHQPLRQLQHQQALLQQQHGLLNPSTLAAGTIMAPPKQGLLGSALGMDNFQAPLTAPGNPAVLPPVDLLPPEQQELQQQQQQQPQKFINNNKQKDEVKANASQLEQQKRHGEVLTNPSVPSANSGLDNAEGNLIVRRGDVLRISRKDVHAHPPVKGCGSSASTSGSPTRKWGRGDNSSNSNGRKDNANQGNQQSEDHDDIEYTVISLLGQGTFAQVFHCVDTKSGNNVAVKIVKNKPAYTRQAAVEIDVFRKLNAVDEGGSKSAEGGDPASTGAGSATNNGASHSANSSGVSSCYDDSSTSTAGVSSSATNNFNCGVASKSIIRLLSYFMHQSHLCLVFEMLGPNLYELLKRRQFRGLPISAVRTLLKQATEGIKLLGKRSVVHCDLKPENILMVRGGASGKGGSGEDVEVVIAECKARGELINAPGDIKLTTSGTNKSDGTHSTIAKDDEDQQYIKLIDFGSACFEGQTTHTYIQSRFYRSPEVLIGLPYDSAIDIWSLGCVAAELFLGLPILPGVHEHDQLGRILEMIGPLPGWMLEQGSKSGKFFKRVPKGGTSGQQQLQHHHSLGPTGSSSHSNNNGGSEEFSSGWEFKTRQEYISHLTPEEKRSKGGLSKLEAQQTNRYFKKKRLEDIVMHHGVCNTRGEREQLGLFVHFLKGVLDPDPWKRWTAHQASMHPFLTGSRVYRIRNSGGDGDAANSGGMKPYDIHWVPPWDASISRRKLMVIRRTQEKAAAAQAAAQQQAQAVAANGSGLRRRMSAESMMGARNTISQSVPESGPVSVPLAMVMPPLTTAGMDRYESPLKASKHGTNILSGAAVGMGGLPGAISSGLGNQIQSPSAASVTSQMAAMADAMSLERARSNISNISGRGGGGMSPPQSLVGNVAGGGVQMLHAQYPSMLSASLGGAGMPLSYQQLMGPGGQPNLAGRSLSENIAFPHADPIAMAAAAQQQQQQQMRATLSCLNDVAFLQPPVPPPALMGAQSFSGMHYPGMGMMPNGRPYPHAESELGYALQRPGVVPHGNDAIAAHFGMAPLRRQTSGSNQQALLAVAQQHQQGQAMLSASLSNMGSLGNMNALSSSTPHNIGAPGTLMNQHFNAFHPSVSGMGPTSPGTLLLQKLGLQEQQQQQMMWGGVRSQPQNGAGAAEASSLLSQQLEEYSQSDNQQQQGQGQHEPQLVHDPNNPVEMGRNGQSFSSNLHPGSYHGGGYDLTPAAAPSASSALPMSHPYKQSASFSDFGNDPNSMQQQHHVQQQQQLQQQHHQQQLQQQQQQHRQVQQQNLQGPQIIHQPLRMNDAFPMTGQAVMPPNDCDGDELDRHNHRQQQQ